MALLTTTVRAKRHPALAGVEVTHLTNLLTSASNAVEAYCNRVFTFTAYAGPTVELHDGDGAIELLVYQPPIVSFTQIDIEDRYGATETILAAEFDTDDEIGLIRFKAETTSDFTYFPHGLQNIDITYEGGYAVIPDEVQDAVIYLAMDMYGQSALTNPSLKSEKLGEYSYTRFDSKDGASSSPAGYMSTTVKALLRNYRLAGGY